MPTRGMTLLEVVFATAILTIVMGALVTMSLGFGDTARVQGIQATNHDECRRALQRVVPDLRNAARMSINWDTLPGETISYQVPMDVDGNGNMLDVNRQLELSTARVIGRDAEDANEDGLGGEQLIAITRNGPLVLANNLSPEAEIADDNGNGILDRGIWFEPWGRGIRVTIQTQGETRSKDASGQGHIIRTTFQEIVYPRN